MGMHRFGILALVGFIHASLPVQAAKIQDWQASYQQRCEEADEECQISLNKLRVSYREALLRHMDKVKGSGKLELVLPVSEEIKALEDGVSSLPALSDGAGEGLKTMREIYEAARDEVRLKRLKTIVELTETLDQALLKREQDLIRSGDIEEAQQARHLREALAKDPDVVEGRRVLMAVEDAAKPGLGGWIPLQSQQMKVISKGAEPVGVLSDLIKQEGPRATQDLAGGTGADPSTVLVTPAPCVIRFNLRQRASKLRGTVRLGIPNGDAKVRIRVGGEKVYEKYLKRDLRDDKFSLNFSPSREIEIEVDMNGHPGSDAIYWTGLEVR